MKLTFELLMAYNVDSDLIIKIMYALFFFYFCQEFFEIFSFFWKTELNLWRVFLKTRPLPNSIVSISILQ